MSPRFELGMIEDSRCWSIENPTGFSRSWFLSELKGPQAPILDCRWHRNRPSGSCDTLRGKSETLHSLTLYSLYLSVFSLHFSVDARACILHHCVTIYPSFFPFFPRLRSSVLPWQNTYIDVYNGTENRTFDEVSNKLSGDPVLGRL